MARILVLCLEAVFAAMLVTPARAQTEANVAPQSYEVTINGEKFRVESGRAVRLDSREKPGTSYNVAVRVAETQSIHLNTVQLEYDMPANVTDDGGRPMRAVRVKHEAGFTMLVTDLGQALETKEYLDVLKKVAGSVLASYREQKVSNLENSKPYQSGFNVAAGQGATIHYQDGEGFGHKCLVYVLGAPQFTVTCVVQYQDSDEEDILPLVRKTLDSIRPLPQPGGASAGAKQ